MYAIFLTLAALAGVALLALLLLVFEFKSMEFYQDGKEQTDD